MYLKDKLFGLLQKISNMTDDNSFPVKKDILELYSDNVLYCPQRNNSIEIQLIDEILYVYNPKHGITLIRTLQCEKEYCNAACDLIDHLENTNCNFKMVNKNMVINTAKVVNYHSSLAKVYFTNDKSISAPVNTKSIPTLNKYVGIKYDLARELIKTQGEYYPISR
jgi:hypothetical protein